MGVAAHPRGSVADFLLLGRVVLRRRRRNYRGVDAACLSTVELLADEKVVQVATDVADVLKRISDRDSLSVACPGNVICQEGDAFKKERVCSWVFLCQNRERLVNVQWPRPRDILRLALSFVRRETGDDRCARERNIGMLIRRSEIEDGRPGIVAMWQSYLCGQTKGEIMRRYHKNVRDVGQGGGQNLGRRSCLGQYNPFAG